MKIMHVVASIDDEAAGPSVSVPRLAEAQKRSGEDVQISTLLSSKNKVRSNATTLSVNRHAPSFSQFSTIHRLGFSDSMRRQLNESSSDVHVFHAHGLWMMPNVYPAWTTSKSGSIFVISPRGMLGSDAIKFSRLKKRVFWHCFQRRAIARAALIHATSESEVDEIRAFGIDVPIVLVPNGVEIPHAGIVDTCNPSAAKQHRTVLSLGRVHPKKGLDRLVTGWARVEDQFPEWRLRIVGPCELNYSSHLSALSNALGCKRVSIEGPLFGEEKRKAYEQSEVFVLPTLNENFAMTVAEALAAATPVISTIGAPWSGLEREGCGWWIDHGAESIADTLENVLKLDRKVLATMGRAGRQWMKREFSWDTLADQMLEAYSWALSAKSEPLPRTIRLNKNS